MPDTLNRAVRREFAYDAGILDYAQAAFPNGLWWIKDRENSNQHQLVDSVRGGNLALTTPTRQQEIAYAAPAGSSVAWCWNAPDAFTSNDGTIPSSGRRNVGAGFSIVSYTGNGQSNQTIGHGLSQFPGFIVTKIRDTSAASPEYATWHESLPDNRMLFLNATKELQDGLGNYFVDSLFSSTLFGVGNDAYGPNISGKRYIAYCWAPIPGYSAMGQYLANGTTDNVFVYTGFRPAFLLVKVIDEVTTSWMLFDSARDTYNPSQTWLGPSNDNAEFQSTAYYHDFLSNGFKIRSSNNVLGASGKNYVWVAFAEHPFGGANVSPSPAR